MFNGQPSSRREFLGRSVALAAVAGVLNGAGPGGAWKIGCYTRPWDQHDYRIALDGIAEAGYRYAGLMTDKGKSWVMVTVETTPDEAVAMGEEVRKRAARRWTNHRHSGGWWAASSVRAARCLNRPRAIRILVPL